MQVGEPNLVADTLGFIIQKQFSSRGWVLNTKRWISVQRSVTFSYQNRATQYSYETTILKGHHSRMLIHVR
jgi:hypothetical protein